MQCRATIFVRRERWTEGDLSLAVGTFLLLTSPAALLSAPAGPGVTQWAASVAGRILSTLTPRVFVGHGGDSGDSTAGDNGNGNGSAAVPSAEAPVPPPRSPEGAAAAQKVEELGGGAAGAKAEDRRESSDESRERVAAAVAAATSPAEQQQARQPPPLPPTVPTPTPADQQQQQAGPAPPPSASKAGTAAMVEVGPFCDLPTPRSALAESRRGLRLLSLEGGGIRGLALVWQARGPRYSSVLATTEHSCA